MIGKEPTIFTIERGYDTGCAIMFQSKPSVNHYTELVISATNEIWQTYRYCLPDKTTSKSTALKSEPLQMGRCTEVVVQIQHTEQQNMPRSGMFQQR